MNEINHLYILKESTPKLLSFLRKRITKEGILIATKLPSENKWYYLAKRLSTFFYNAHKIYFPVHLVFFLLRLRKKSLSVKDNFMRALTGWFRSNLYVALFAMSIPVIGVMWNDVIGPLNSTGGFVISFFFSMFFFVESSHRWGEISMWVFAQWLQSIPLALNKKRINIDIPHFSKMLFGLAMALISHCYYSEGKLNKKLQFLMKFIVGEKDIEEVKSKKEHKKCPTTTRQGQ